LRSWRDGWRHLRFLLIFCPRWLFLYPGALLFALGALAMAALLLFQHRDNIARLRAGTESRIGQKSR
jgi:glycerol-3-phosphate acyltransferase PlsY